MSRVFSGSSKFKSCPGSGNLLSIHCCLSESWLEEWRNGFFSGLRWAPCFLKLRPFFGGFFYNFFDEILAVFSICKIHPAISSCFVAPRVYGHNRDRPSCNLLHFLLGGGKISGSCEKKLQNLIDIGFFRQFELFYFLLLFCRHILLLWIRCLLLIQKFVVWLEQLLDVLKKGICE